MKMGTTQANCCMLGFFDPAKVSDKIKLALTVSKSFPFLKEKLEVLKGELPLHMANMANCFTCSAFIGSS
jgi:hypothetical protein